MVHGLEQVMLRAGIGISIPVELSLGKIVMMCHQHMNDSLTSTSE